MATDGIICFQNPRNPLMVRAGTTRHWMMNYSDLKLTYKLSMQQNKSQVK
uniref:Ovule protein n=1 Tax=Haemonchus contortus TaxID=6289 RepID=A0A7I4Z6F5_HAECO